MKGNGDLTWCSLQCLQCFLESKMALLRVVMMKTLIGIPLQSNSTLLDCKVFFLNFPEVLK